MKTSRFVFVLSALLLAAASCSLPTANPSPGSDSPSSSSSNPPAVNQPSSSNPPATNPPTSQQMTVAGTVWHDACALPDGALPSPLPEGCMDDGLGYAIADGFRSPGEEGIAGVSVQLISGECNTDSLITGSIISMTATDAQGHYSFDVAVPGSYCVLIDPLAAPNDAILIPGRWSFPQVTDGWAVYEFTFDAIPPTMGPADFGWDYQFLPAYTAPQGGNPVNAGAPPAEPSFIVDVPANCRQGPSQTFLQVTSFPAGTILSLSGRTSDSSWWLVQANAAETCWISSATGHTSGDTSGVPVVSYDSAPPAASSTDTKPPYISDAYANVTEAYYMTSACGPTEILITAEIEDASGIADTYVQYRFMGDSGYVGSWHTAGFYRYGAGAVEYQFLINTGEAEFEFYGENGSVQYQVYARDNAGNVSSYPAGFVLGVPVYFCP